VKGITYGQLALAALRGAVLGGVLFALWHYNALEEAIKDYSAQFKRPLTKIERDVKEVLDRKES
jgi:hypothetical protein